MFYLQAANITNILTAFYSPTTTTTPLFLAAAFFHATSVSHLPTVPTHINKLFTHLSPKKPGRALLPQIFSSLLSIDWTCCSFHFSHKCLLVYPQHQHRVAHLKLFFSCILDALPKSQTTTSIDQFQAPKPQPPFAIHSRPKSSAIFWHAQFHSCFLPMIPLFFCSSSLCQILPAIFSPLFTHTQHKTFYVVFSLLLPSRHFLLATLSL